MSRNAPLRSAAFGLATTVALGYASGAAAVPVTYSYAGEPFTTTNISADWEVGLDHIVGTFTVDLPNDFADLPGIDRKGDLISFLFKGERVGRSDPVLFQNSFNKVTRFVFSTDASGNIGFWDLTFSGFSDIGGQLPASLSTRSAIGDFVSFTANFATRSASTRANGTFTIESAPGGGTVLPVPATAGFLLLGLAGLGLAGRTGARRSRGG